MRPNNPFLVRTCVLLALLLSGCGPAAAPSPTAKPAVPPTSTPASQSTPTTVQPTPRPASPTPSAKAASPEDPKYGGIATRVMTGDIPSFDLQREQAGTASAPLFNVYQGLVRIHPVDWTVVTELAQKWEISPDGKSYTFTFYKGIKWHDGQPFTMEDVKHSLERMQNPEAFKTISPRGKGLLARMDTVEITGEDTVKINLKNASAPFLRNLATGWVPIEPKHVIVAKGDMRRDAIGTGAFKLKESSTGVGVTLQKNSDYYIKGLPYLDGIQIYIIKDAATRFSAFRTGKVKITYLGTGNLTPTEADTVRNEMADRAVVYQHDSQSRHSVTFNLQRKPWDDVRIRKAVDLAYDRQAAIKINGIGYIGSIYVSGWGTSPDDLVKLPGYRQPKDADVAEAKKLIAEAGFPNGFKTTLLGRPGGAAEQQAVVAKDQLAKIGIEAELVLMDQTTLLERAGRGAFDMIFYNWLDDTGDPDETLNLYYGTGGSRNYGGFSDTALDELITKQALTMDGTARKAILSDIEKKVMDEVPMVIAFWDIQQTGAWKEVKNFKPGPGMHPWGKFDLMWLAR